jgi:ATP-dependent Clp protease ATP-binding subunit ClpA
MDLRRRIVGQDEAIQQIVSVYQAYLTGMTPACRPIGNLLFLGPTGSGKTRIVEATSEALLKNARAVIKIDCAEFQHSHEIAKLVGAPPGYQGHCEKHPLLNQEALNQFHTKAIRLSLVLFDEIEKASDALWNLLLGILDKGTLTLGDNRKVDFSRALIFMTSNLGTPEMSALMQPRLGFNRGETARRSQNGAVDDKLSARLSRSGMQAARRKFTPEFINRLDRIVTFKPLGLAELKKILDIELSMIQQRIFNTRPQQSFVFEASDGAKEFLLQEGADLKYGARHLKRAIERLLVQPMSNLIATGQVRGGDWVFVDFDAQRNTLVFFQNAGRAMTSLVDRSIQVPAWAITNVPVIETAKSQTARVFQTSTAWLVLVVVTAGLLLLALVNRSGKGAFMVVIGALIVICLGQRALVCVLSNVFRARDAQKEHF